MQEDTILCPKGCGTSLPSSQMFKHFQSCQGKVPIPSLVSDIIQSIPTWPTVEAPPIKIDQPKIIKEEVLKPSYCPKCGTEYIVTSLYQACTKCKSLKVRRKVWWWLMVRYGFMIMWISLLGGFIWGIYSYHRLFP